MNCSLAPFNSGMCLRHADILTDPPSLALLAARRSALRSRAGYHRNQYTNQEQTPRLRHGHTLRSEHPHTIVRLPIGKVTNSRVALPDEKVTAINITITVEVAQTIRFDHEAQCSRRG